MKGKRARFTGRLDEQDEAVKFLMDEIKNTQDNLMVTALQVSKQLIHLGDAEIERLELEEKSISGRLSELNRRLGLLHYRAHRYALQLEYWSKPWYKRLTTHKPI